MTQSSNLEPFEKTLNTLNSGVIRNIGSIPSPVTITVSVVLLDFISKNSLYYNIRLLFFFISDKNKKFYCINTGNIAYNFSIVNNIK